MSHNAPLIETSEVDCSRENSGRSSSTNDRVGEELLSLAVVAAAEAGVNDPTGIQFTVIGSENFVDPEWLAECAWMHRGFELCLAGMLKKELSGKPKHEI